jgi:pyocin large subunit-like protein
VLVEVIGFISAWDRDEHFAEQRAEFGARFTSAQAYEAGAVAFFNEPLVGTMMEGVRSDGWRIRFDSATDEFAICDSEGYVRTYYKPDPRKHKFRNNISYFRRRCLQ